MDICASFTFFYVLWKLKENMAMREKKIKRRRRGGVKEKIRSKREEK